MAALYVLAMSRKNNRANIKRYGWHFLYVFDPEGKRENFGYSIGFEQTFSHPEVLIFGLPKEPCHGIMSVLAEGLESGMVFEVGERVSGILQEDLTVMFKTVKPEAYSQYLGTAVDYYEKNFRALVMFWPDESNTLPTENGCRVAVQNEALNIV